MLISVSQVSNEEATCECHERRAGSGKNLSPSCVFVLQTHDVTSLSSIVIRAITFLPQRSRGRRGAIDFRSLVETSPGLSIFRHTQQFQQVVFTRGCVIVFWNGTWMIQAQAFLYPVPFVVGPSAESRRHDSTLGAVFVHFSLTSSPKQDVPSHCRHDFVVVVKEGPTRTHGSHPDR